ncbi:hypothetical protein [Planococcus maitriensis]|uniref:Uncharacterized protein n=1 Tax=Planococcus maitriensis TaxID=221799 RepID=A0A365KA68_9BACL|nr:hypothetical protein [Planococcus maitriensis]RAZ69658.1 hypothetical protein DP119_03095 [Planococcus maitriensis]
MMGTHHATSTIEKAAESAAEEVVTQTGHCRMGDKPESAVQAGLHQFISWPLDREVSVQVSRDEQEGLNEAEMLISLENMQRFTQALIEHPIPLPTSYSQSSMAEGGTYMLRIASKEAFPDFVKRLADALSVLPRQK